MELQLEAQTRVVKFYELIQTKLGQSKVVKQIPLKQIKETHKNIFQLCKFSRSVRNNFPSSFRCFCNKFYGCLSVKQSSKAPAGLEIHSVIFSCCRNLSRPVMPSTHQPWNYGRAQLTSFKENQQKKNIQIIIKCDYRAPASYQKTGWFTVNASDEN